MRICAFLFFLSSFCYSQPYEKLRIISAKDSMPIENAYITVDNWLTTTSDKLGYFKIKDEYKTIQISHLSYKPTIIYKEHLTYNVLYLEEHKNILQEIVLTTKKREKTLMPSNNYNSIFTKKTSYIVNQNTIYATFIPNLETEASAINKIIIEVSEEIEGDMPFRVNLYQVNEKTKLPGNKMLNESILTYYNSDRTDNLIKIDISDFLIDFPKEGINVVVESLNLLELEKLGTNISQPAFRAVKRDKKSKSVTYDKLFTWNRLTRTKDSIIKDWVDDRFKPYNFIFNFGIEIQFFN